VNAYAVEGWWARNRLIVDVESNEVQVNEDRGVTGERGGMIGMKYGTGAGWCQCCESAQAAKSDGNGDS
jgi:hypothetical protein